MRYLMVVTLASALLAQSSPKAGAAPIGNAERGKKIFVTDGCYQCHGRAAQGGAAGPRIGPRPIAFAAFTMYVRQPAGQMPPYTSKVVSDQDLADIWAFLQSLPQPPAVKSIPALQN
jgi:mono/diheme cytochrome c family protein